MCPFTNSDIFFSDNLICPIAGITQDESDSYTTPCIEDINPDVLNMNEEQQNRFKNEHVAVIMRCIAEKVGLVDERGVLDSQERQKRGIASSCTEWDTCWKAAPCETIS